MSSRNVFERLFKLWASVCKLVLDGKRSAEKVCLALQTIIDENAPAAAVPDIPWAEVYKVLGMENEYAEIAKTLVVSSQLNLWVMPVIKGVTCDKAVQALRKLGVDLYSYVNNLDKDVKTNDRDPNRNGSYIISFRCSIEADEENKYFSANQLKECNHKGITLLERLLLELGYFLATGKHLDEKSWTLCAGSRCSDGGVPRVYWCSDGREVYVDWCSPDYSDAYLCSRSAVFS